jgi:hypothetical protein
LARRICLFPLVGILLLLRPEWSWLWPKCIHLWLFLHLILFILCCGIDSAEVSLFLRSSLNGGEVDSSVKFYFLHILQIDDSEQVIRKTSSEKVEKNKL